MALGEARASTLQCDHSFIDDAAISYTMTFTTNFTTLQRTRMLAGLCTGVVGGGWTFGHAMSIFGSDRIGAIGPK
jgi:hypothetical protein